MEEIWRYLFDHWQWNAIVLMLVIAANLQGRLAEMKRANKWLHEHGDWLRERNDDWLRLFGEVGVALADKHVDENGDEDAA